MDYIALYRKFRPQSFAELVGQEAVAATLAKAVATGNIVHAYLFCGPRGTGKTSVAKILAKAINCENPHNGSPCCECAACKRIADGSSLDIMEIDAASNRGIDEIRDLRERVKYASANEKYKVYIIDEVHMLTTEAFNALLKTLEEPPRGVIFILATTEPHKIPLTVISRCQRFDFKRIPEAEIYGRLQYVAAQEQIAVEDNALRLIAKRAQGGLRDALGLLDQCHSFAENQITAKTIAAVLGTVDEEFNAALCNAILQNDVNTVLDKMAEFTASGKDIRQFLYDLNEYLRDMLGESLKDKPKAERLLGILSLLTETESRLRYSMQPQLAMELALLKACGWQEQAAKQPDITPPKESGKQAKLQPLKQEPPHEPSRKPQPTQKQPAPVKEKAAPAIKQTEAPAVEQQGQTVTLSLQRIQNEWQAVLAAVSARSMVVNAFLQHAKPSDLQDGNLMLDYIKDYAVHMNNIIAKPNNKQLLETCLKEYFGQNIKIKARLVEATEQEMNFTPSDEETSLFE